MKKNYLSELGCFPYDIIVMIIRHCLEMKKFLLLSKTYINIIVSLNINEKFWLDLSHNTKIPKYIKNVHIKRFSDLYCDYNWNNIRKISIRICSSDIFCPKSCEVLEIYCDCGNKCNSKTRIVDSSSFVGLQVLYFTHNGTSDSYNLLRKIICGRTSLKYIATNTKDTDGLIISLRFKRAGDYNGFMIFEKNV